jgi:hypothetical protein
MPTYHHVDFLWDDATAASLDPVGRLVYRSNLLGRDQRITNTGGGNTSSKITEKDPLSGQPTEVLWVKGSGGDLRTSTAGQLLLALPAEADRPAAALCRAQRQGPEVARGGRHGGDVHAHHVQPEPARVLDRHAAAQLHPGEVRRSHAPQRDHRDRGLAELRKAHEGNLRRRNGLRAVDATRLRARARHAGDRANPHREVDHDGSARLHLVGGRRKGLLHATRSTDRKGRRLHRGEVRGQGRRRRGVRRRKVSDPPEDTSGTPPSPRSCPGCAARFPRRSGSSARCRTTNEDPALRELKGCPAPGRARDVLSRPLPAHEDQAALRRLESADGGRSPP